MRIVLVASLIAWSVPSVAQDAITTIILVRHAEKDTAAIDPALSPAGKKRVEHLQAMLSKSRIDAIFSTQYRRAYETVEPIAKARGLHVQVTMRDAMEPLSQHVEDVIHKILGEQSGRAVLISSHSNIVPEILKRLGVTEPVTIDDWMYDDLFVVTRTKSGIVSMLRLKYGTPTP
jgi:broad specificity phosphatase PhoE